MSDGEGGLPEGTQQPGMAVSARPSSDLVESVTRLDRAIKERRETDTTFVNWWVYFLLLSWLTLGIYPLYIYYKRMARVDGFSRRKKAYYRSLVEWTEREAEATGKGAELHHEMADLGGEVNRAYEKDLRPINAGIALLLTFVTLGIYGIWVTYRLNRYWWDAQVFEQDFDDKLSQAWAKLGIVKYPINFQIDNGKNRNFWLYLVLTIVTFGIWGLVWDYKLYTDPENLYPEYHSIEDTVLQTIRAQ